MVATKATVAKEPTLKALPALKPNQPNHNIPIPNRTKGTLWGAWGTTIKLFREPIIQTITTADTPELIWTTVPPAKSKEPMACNQPRPQTQWARGE